MPAGHSRFWTINSLRSGIHPPPTDQEFEFLRWSVLMAWLKNFDFRKWWHPAIGLGLALAVLALAIKNRDIAMFGLGIVTCGFGERTLDLYNRFSRPIGFALFGLGGLLIAMALYDLVKS